jgi:hypothetical protein
LKASFSTLQATLSRVAHQDEQLAASLRALLDQFAYAQILALLSDSASN